MRNKLNSFLFYGLIISILLLPVCLWADQADVLYREGLELENKGQRDFAVFKYFTITRNYPNSKWADEALFKIGQFYYENRDYFNASGTFESLIRQYPRSPLVKDAKAYLENIAAVSKRSDIESSIRYILSTIETYKSDNNWDEMMNECSKLSAFEPLSGEHKRKLIEYYTICGEAYLKQDSLGKAKVVYEKLIAITPDDTEVLNTLYEINKLLKTTAK